MSSQDTLGSDWPPSLVGTPPLRLPWDEVWVLPDRDRGAGTGPSSHLARDPSGVAPFSSVSPGGSPSGHGKVPPGSRSPPRLRDGCLRRYLPPPSVLPYTPPWDVGRGPP